MNEGLKELQEKALRALVMQEQYFEATGEKPHKHRCHTCALRGVPHEAEFNELSDVDGSKMLNLVTEDTVVAQVWVNLYGCRNWIPRVMPKGERENV